MIVTRTELAELYNVDRRTVTNWINSDPPCPSWKDGNRRKFDTAKVAEWREAQAVSKAVSQMSRSDPEDLEEAKRRKLVAEALLAEIEVQEKQGKLVPLDIHENAVGDVCDRLRAVVINLPSNFSVYLERAGVEPKAAQEALEKMSDVLMRALRAVGDDLEDDVDAND